MSTWLDRWDRRYTDRVRLLVEILPVLAQEPRFALKGGTAINLFEHGLPRLSVDIDLAWLPVHDYAEDARLIAGALARLADALRARPLQLQVQTSAGEGAGTVTRLVASRGRARVQIETTPVMRGTVHPVRNMVVRPRVEEAFGFAEVQVLDFADLYAGKLAAALSRQHPRDLFDVGLLLEDGRADELLWRTFLVYLTCSPKPAWEMLAPRVPADFAATFDAHFKGMTAEPISAQALLESRERLLARVAEWLDEPSHAFLRSVEDEQPDYGLIGLPHAAELPGVRRKLHNLAQRSAAKRAADRRQLEETLARIVDAR
ncbi:nucleotidyl transferase AbiEii/AbiGii toxin family protein [Alicycliphilus denitrificans]|uniref:Nucleotidyl transferase AbiEii/AbiGii toxin family protein n=1 Tax=Alicycliphilus denitrificans TaxID=179636 RepID=A0A420KHL9_9BURK|nr:nucleotidyl transferase AbiEii/AbiGii toxin family protein [Alicycliphilus denitrificans]RKJ99447.1 nucleotidyl transferase AbiEii/AbiGii toxin family protein [Alicycliphilus denitrificans]